MLVRQYVTGAKLGQRVFILTLGCALAFPVLADDDESGLPVVLSASRVRQPLAEAPAAVTVIDRQMIEQSGVRQIADLLRFVPGAAVGYNDGNWPVVTLRGMSGAFASGLQVLVDGVSVYSPVFGGMLWAELPLSLDDIERIEVVRGPNGASYGANSFQGVVNIITRDPVADDNFKLSTNAGGLGIRDEAIRYASGQGDWRYRATIGQRFDDGFASRPDSMRLTYGNLKTSYQASLRDSVDFSLRFAEKNKQLGEFSTADPTFSPHHQTGDHMELQVRWSRAESTDNEWWVQYYHQQFSQRDRFPFDLRGLNPLLLALFPTTPLLFEFEQDYQTWRDGIEFQSNVRWTPQFRSVMGAEFRRDAARSQRLFATNDEQTELLSRTFGNIEWNFANGWILHTGTMFERNSMASNGWSSRVALIHEIVPGHTLRASASNAWRTPTLYEEKANYRFDFPIPVPPFNIPYPIITATGKVDSESVRAEEIGYVFDVPEASLNGDVRWFAERYGGLIAFQGQVEFVSGGDAINLDRVETSGIDWTIRWAPRAGTLVRVAGSHADTTSTDMGGQYSTSVPRSTLAILISQAFGAGWEISANYQRIGEMFWIDAGQGKRSIPAIDHLNLRLAKTFSGAGYDVEVAGVLQNALGHYRDYYLGSAFGTPDNIARRVGFLQLSVKY